jgi:arylsulfatase A-like enzyme
MISEKRSRTKGAWIISKSPGFCLKFTLLLMAVLLASGCEKKQRPPVFLIVIDTCRADHLSCYGYPLNTSPRIDRFAKDSIRFTTAVSQSPWTLPSVASILTSAYPSTHGATGTIKEGFHRLEGVRPATVLLSEKGFTTQAIINNSFFNARFGMAEGFQGYDNFNCSNDRIRDAGRTCAMAADWLEERDERQGGLFLFLHLFDPHLDYDPPDAYRTRFVPEGLKTSLSGPVTLETVRAIGKQGGATAGDLAYLISQYDGEIAYCDDALGGFFSALKRMDLYDRALIILTSDHGEEFLDHQGLDHGHTLFDELIRVPLIIKMPGNAEAGRVVSSQVRLIDIMPTIFDVLDLSPPGDMAGSSLLPLIRGRDPGHGRQAFSEALLYGEEKKSIRDESIKLIYDPVGGRHMLFDLSQDPKEQRNLYRRRPDAAEKMRAKLAAYLKAERTTGKRVELDAETMDNLRALGYMN